MTLNNIFNYIVNVDLEKLIQAVIFPLGGLIFLYVVLFTFLKVFLETEFFKKRQVLSNLIFMLVFLVAIALAIFLITNLYGRLPEKDLFKANLFK